VYVGGKEIAPFHELMSTQVGTTMSVMSWVMAALPFRLSLFEFEFLDRDSFADRTGCTNISIPSWASSKALEEPVGVTRSSVRSILVEIAHTIQRVVQTGVAPAVCAFAGSVFAGLAVSVTW